MTNVRADWAWRPDEVTLKAIKSGDAKMKRVADNRKLEAIPQEAVVRKLIRKAEAKEKRAATLRAKRKPIVKPDQIIDRRITVGEKRAMEMLCDAITAQGRKPPRLRLRDVDPVWRFVLSMYEEIARWPVKNLAEFVRETTGETPTDVSEATLLGEVKRLFHEMFGHEDPHEANLKDPMSVWKMWPHVRLGRNETEETEESEMQTQTETNKSRRSKFSNAASAPLKADAKAAKKQAAEATAAPKKQAVKAEAASKKSASKKSAPAKKKASSSEVSRTPFQFDPKQAEKAGVANLARIRLDDGDRIEFVKDPTEGGIFQELADGAKAKSVKTMAHLIAKMKSSDWDEKKTRSYTAKLIRRGCIRVIS